MLESSVAFVHAVGRLGLSHCRSACVCSYVLNTRASQRPQGRGAGVKWRGLGCSRRSAPTLTLRDGSKERRWFRTVWRLRVRGSRERGGRWLLLQCRRGQATTRRTTAAVVMKVLVVVVVAVAAGGERSERRVARRRRREAGPAARGRARARAVKGYRSRWQRLSSRLLLRLRLLRRLGLRQQAEEDGCMYQRDATKSNSCIRRFSAVAATGGYVIISIPSSTSTSTFAVAAVAVVAVAAAAARHTIRRLETLCGRSGALRSRAWVPSERLYRRRGAKRPQAAASAFRANSGSKVRV